MAANKYLAFELIKDLTDHIAKNCEDVSNVSLIYDQLLKLGIKDPLVSEIEQRIATRFFEVCASESFEQIDEKTLVSILNFNILNVSEFELLKVCLRWTDNKVARQRLSAGQASKRATFEPIKHLIRFGDIKLKKIGSIIGLENYLTFEEIGALFVHLFHPSCPTQVSYQSPRKARKAQIALGIKDNGFLSHEIRDLKTFISVDKAVSILSIKTLAITDYSALELKVYKNEMLLFSDAKIVTAQAGYVTQPTIGLNLLLEPNTYYELRFFFTIPLSPRYSSRLYTSNEMTLKSEGGGLVFSLRPDPYCPPYHCIESISFFGPFE